MNVYNETLQKVMTYKLFYCWPSEFTVLPEMDGNGNPVAMQSLTLDNEGWERGASVSEPTEPSFSMPTS